jgi:NADPH:quinone reductase-like Zn-dependent oxidoreductase
MLSPLVKQKLGILAAKENAADLSVLRGLVESGNVTPAIDHTFPLSQVPQAIRYLQDGKARGKIVIII